MELYFNDPLKYLKLLLLCQTFLITKVSHYPSTLDLTFRLNLLSHFTYDARLMKQQLFYLPKNQVNELECT